MIDNTIWIKVEAKRPSLKREIDEMIRSVEGMRIQRSHDSRRADLLIFELGDDADKEFEVIESLLTTNAVGGLFLMSTNSEPSILLKAIRTGAKEFFPLPLKDGELRQALERFKRKREKPDHEEPDKMGKIITVIGSKGGIGTTTLAVNLAINLVEKSSVQSVALVDMNMLFGDIPLFLELKPGYHWGEIARNISRLDPTFLMNILSKHRSGLYVLPSPGYLNGTGHEAATPEMMGYLLGLMQNSFDFVIIDAGQSVDNISLKILEMSTSILVVSMLSLPCLANTNKLLKSFNELGFAPQEQIMVVINRYLKKSTISLKDAEESIEKKIFWIIPNDYNTTVSAINNGRALSEVASKAPITKSLKKLAETFVPKEENKKRKWWNVLKRA